jgi:DhnA family fructose-bisphosphate aldolase class Ia
VGSEFEPEMLAEVGKLIAQAHEHGLITVIWAYPRGKSIPDPKDAHVIAGATGVACSLGSDFVKVNFPTQGARALKEAVGSAGRTGVIVSGGDFSTPQEFLKMTYNTLHLAGVAGSATGRNVHEHPLEEAIRMTDALSALVYGNKTADEAYQVFLGKDSYKLL